MAETLTLKDILSHLSYVEARTLLGPQGAKLIRNGGRWDIDIETQTTLEDTFFLLSLGEASVTIKLSDARNRRLSFSCTACRGTCEHIGAAFSLILEEKLSWLWPGRVR
jgi:hypothetical protein